MANTSTKTQDAEWRAAQAERLLDADSYADWLYGKCMSCEVSESNAHMVARLLATGCAFEAQGFDIADIQWLALTDSDPVIRLAALDLILAIHSAEHADDIAELLPVDIRDTYAEDPYDRWKDQQDFLGAV